jgi:hypothetical protein
MIDRNRDLPPELERQWRQWASTEPTIDEQQLKRNLMERIAERRLGTRSRLVLLAAAASLLAVFIGLESTHRPRPEVVATGTAVHETGANVILVVRESGEPIYIATETSKKPAGE